MGEPAAAAAARWTVGRRWLRLLALAWIAAGCGQGDEPMTPYGRQDEVRRYRQRLEPVIAAVNAVEMEVDSAAVGSSGQATAANLARVYARVQPRLRQALEELQALVPPARLEPLQRDMEQAVRLRLGAFDAVLEGWARQQEQGENEHSAALYRQAEEALASARALLAQVNTELAQVDVALGDAAGANPVSA